jgi:hypothetical protein
LCSPYRPCEPTTPTRVTIGRDVLTVDKYTGPAAWQHEFRQKIANLIFTDDIVCCSWGWMCVRDLMNRGFLHEERAVITGKGIELLQNDPSLLVFQDDIVESMKNNPSYGVEGFEYHTAKDVTFGKTGNRFIDGFQPETWMIRAVRLKADAYATISGDIYINYHTRYDEVYDLRGAPRRSERYNQVTTGLGYIWHDILGASDEMQVYAQWITVIK